MYSTYTILVADDDIDSIRTIVEFLSDTAADVIHATNGKDAVELAFEKKPNLIVMDWEMPVMTGIEAIEKLKSDPITSEIPIIVASGVMTESKDLESALEIGAIDFLRKPLDHREFKARIRSAMRSKQQLDTIRDLLERENELLTEQLEHKERELTSMAMYDLQQKRLLDELSKEIQKLNRITNFTFATQINEIERELRARGEIERTWSNFKVHFEEVHPDFFDKLREQFGNISKNDLKLLAYLKIGMDNKDIAQMSNITSASVSRALSRLKQKLNLDQEKALRDFVMKL